MMFSNSRVLLRHSVLVPKNCQSKSHNQRVTSKNRNHFYYEYSKAHSSESDVWNMQHVDNDEFVQHEESHTPEILEEGASKLNEVKLQIEFWRQREEQIPNYLNENNWIKLLSLETDEMKLSYLRSLWIRKNRNKLLDEIRAANKNQYQECKSKKQSVQITTNGPMIYSLTHNTLFHRIYDDKIEKFNNYKLLQTRLFGPHLVIDCGLLGENEPEKNKTGLMYEVETIFNRNKNSSFPVNLIFCNVHDYSFLITKLRKRWKYFDDPCHPFQYTSKSYTDLFNSEKLVYITRCRSLEPLITYNHDDIYILPGMVGKQNYAPIISKTKRENIRVARLPISEFKTFVAVKRPTLEGMFAVMNDLRRTNDWRSALRNLNCLKQFKDIRCESDVDEKLCRQDLRPSIYKLLLNK